MADGDKIVTPPQLPQDTSPEAEGIVQPQDTGDESMSVTPDESTLNGSDQLQQDVVDQFEARRKGGSKPRPKPRPKMPGGKKGGRRRKV